MIVRIFKHYMPVQIIALAAVDIVILFCAMYVGVQSRFVLGPEWGFENVLPIWPKALAYTIIMFIVMHTMGLYERDVIENKLSYYVRFMMSFGLGLIAMVAVFYALPSLFLGRGAFGLSMTLSMVTIFVARNIVLHVSHDALRQRILILGAGSRAAQVEEILHRHKLSKKFHLVGFVPVGVNHYAVNTAKIIHHEGSLLSAAVKHRVDEIVVAVRERRGGNLAIDELLECKLEGVRVIDVASFFERETGHVHLDALSSSWMVFSDGFCRTSGRNLVKRIFDVTVSTLLLALTLPVFVLTALAIAFETGMPIFYRQLRVGECGHPFHVLKFRSMRVDAEKDGAPQWAKKGDARVTRVGRFIRKVRIDELPQLFNVLRGDMSFVGPRPERPFFVRELEQQIPYYASRHTVKPGITGWAQIRYPYGASVEDAREKLQYDLYYAKNHSLFLDIVILMQTAQVVLMGKGAR